MKGLDELSRKGTTWVGGEDDLVCPMGGSWEGSPVKGGIGV